jgi:hypothetical protein
MKKCLFKCRKKPSDTQRKIPVKVIEVTQKHLMPKAWIPICREKKNLMEKDTLPLYPFLAKERGNVPMLFNRNWGG